MIPAEHLAAPSNIAFRDFGAGIAYHSVIQYPARLRVSNA